MKSLMFKKKDYIISFLGLQINLKKEIKSILLAIFLSYLFIFLVILIKCKIFEDTIEDVYKLAIKGLSLYGTISYGIFCFFQEVLFRGVLQRSLLKKIKNTFIVIAITTLLFLICHYNYDFITIIGALFISIVTSFTTIKDDNIYRAFFFHWIVGGLGYVFITLSFFP